MNISILGTGALGIALANTLSNNGYTVLMWTKFIDEKERLEAKRENEITLPGIKISHGISITNNLEEICSFSKVIINILPFVAVENTAEELKETITPSHIICSTTKGIDMQTFETSTQIFERICGTKKVCALSGPSFAIEIANKEPICLELGGKDQEVNSTIKEIFSCNNINVEITEDAIGVQLCGAVKNAIAIGSGMLYGMKAADSTRAAYLARGIKDMTIIINELGGDAKTVYTYAGIGDLILTCMSEKSRNFSCGKLLGEGKSLKDAVEILSGKTVEGIKVIEAIHNFAQKKNLKLDTIPKLYDIVFNGGKLDKIKEA